jgi:hypothetical protein
MKRKILVGLMYCFLMSAILAISGIANAFTIDFEDGIDGGNVNNISGVSFESFLGYNPLYGDSRTSGYNTTSDDLGYGFGSYHHNGNFFVWSGPNSDARGLIINFTNNDGTWFTTGYSSFSNFYVEAYLTDGNMVSTMGAANTGSQMGFLTVNATGGAYIDYIVLHDTGNYWCIDDLSGDTTSVNATPEPSTMIFLGIGLIGFACISRKKTRR